MHRSGTSLVAQIAYSAGANFGNPETFWPADSWNPAGYFEQKEIIKLNRKLINGSLGRLHYFFPPSEGLIRRRAEKCRPEITLLAGKYADNLVKENRFCLTISEWLDSGAMIDKILVVFRDPAKVAHSLRRRNKIPRAVSNMLWYEHLSRLERSAPEIPRNYLWYDSFVNSYQGTVQGLNKISWLTGIDSSNLRLLAKPIVRRSELKPGGTSDNYPVKVAKLYKDLIEKSQMPISPGKT
jgi:hypothetical protein